MTSVFTQSLRHNFDYALVQLEQAMRNCPDSKWTADLWPDEAPTATHDYGAIRGSAPWLLALHALVCLDYDIAGEFERWLPPGQLADCLVGPDPTRALTQTEVLTYLDYCRARVDQILDAMTDEVAARPLPAAHRYCGASYGVIVGSIPTHVVEHATQITQFYR